MSQLAVTACHSSVSQLARIHRAEEIPIYSFGRGYLEAIGETLPRRAVLSVSRSGGDLYFDVDGQTHTTTVLEHRIG